VIRVAILTVSDRCSRGEAEDLGGPAVATAVEGMVEGAEVVARDLVADDRAVIADRIRALSGDVDLVLTTGGTGVSVRDVTPEATRDVLEFEIPGLGEEMRRRSAERLPSGLLSRSTAGVLGRCVIVNLPGNPNGAVECLGAVAPALGHAIEHRRRPGVDIHKSGGSPA
jgi:molybdopterin adenylyltransferase